MKTIIKHFENGLREFFSEDEFIGFTKQLCHENGDELIFPISTYASAMIYLNEFCDNFELIYSGFEG